MAYDYGNYYNVGMDWNSLMNDPYFMAAWNTQNANSYYSNASNVSFKGNPYGTTDAGITTNKSDPLADMSKLSAGVAPVTNKSGSGGALVAGGSILAVGAAACIAAKTGHLQPFLNKVKGFFGKGGRAMKEFSLLAEDGAKIVVKDGKICDIFRKSENKILKGSEIDKYLASYEKGVRLPKQLVRNGKLVEGVELTKYFYNKDGYKYIVENGKVTKIINTATNKPVKAGEEFDKLANKIKATVDSIANGGNSSKINEIVTQNGRDICYNYTWERNNLVYTFTGGKRPVETLTVPQPSVAMTEAQRNAYLHENDKVNKAINELIENGRADKVIRDGYWFKADNGDMLYLDKEGKIQKIKLKNSQTVISRDAKDPTAYHDYLFRNKSIEEAAKKDFESGLATDSKNTLFRMSA